MISVAQSPIVIKMQGSWGAKDIFNDMANEYVKRVNDMSGGRLRIDYLLASGVEVSGVRVDRSVRLSDHAPLTGQMTLPRPGPERSVPQAELSQDA